jgi:light-regulated signal transduction histidine kinase (bacteriophytochrome)
MNTHVIAYLNNKLRALTADCIQNKVSWSKFESKTIDIGTRVENEIRFALGEEPIKRYDFELLFSAVGG